MYEFIDAGGNAPVKAMLKRAFPGYRGRKFRMLVTDGAVPLQSYWDGGSRDYILVVDLTTGRFAPVPENGSGFTAVDRKFGPGGIPVHLPAPGYAVARHVISRGKHLWVSLEIHPANVAGFANALPAQG